MLRGFCSRGEVFRYSVSRVLLRPSRCSSSKPDENVTNSHSLSRLHISDLAKSDVAIEKRSLSRGLSMNKFEKDFFIYPEYHDTDDVRNIEGYVGVLRNSLQECVDSVQMDKDGALSESVKLALDKSALSAVFVPSEFQGLGMNQKDKLRICEELSIDWSIFSQLGIVSSFVDLLIVYGSDEIKEKYLPLIAQGKYRLGVAMVDKCSGTEFPEVVGNMSGHGILSGQMKIVSGNDPNLLLVFANSTHSTTKNRLFSCYLIDRTTLGTEAKWDSKREETLGMKALEVNVLDIHIPLDGSSILGEEGQGDEIRNELQSTGRLPLSAAVVGYSKRLLDDLSAMCNQTTSNSLPNGMLSHESNVQRTITQLATKVYCLESVSYYLGGMLDENLPVVVDIENALLNRLSLDVLRSCVSTMVELCGLNATSSSFQYEKHIRDISTLMAMNGGESNTVEKVAMATLSAWTSVSHKKPSSSLSRLFGGEKTLADLRDPKLTHYIAEHAHPSLQLACQELEFSMSRINSVIGKIVAEQGKNLETDYGTLENLVRVLQNNLCIVAVISRASRSYAIGLRNADIELAWTTTIATRLSRENWFELESLSDYFGLVKLNPSLLNVGRAVLDMGGYRIESPLERNW